MPACSRLGAEAKINVCKEGECKTWVPPADKMYTGAVSYVSAISACILQDTLKRAVVPGCSSYQASQPQLHWAGLLEEFNQNSEKTHAAVQRGGNAAQNSRKNCYRRLTL